MRAGGAGRHRGALPSPAAAAAEPRGGAGGRCLAWARPERKTPQKREAGAGMELGIGGVGVGGPCWVVRVPTLGSRCAEPGRERVLPRPPGAPARPGETGMEVGSGTSREPGGAQARPSLRVRDLPLNPLGKAEGAGSLPSAGRLTRVLGPVSSSPCSPCPLRGSGSPGPPEEEPGSAGAQTCPTRPRAGGTRSILLPVSPLTQHRLPAQPSSAASPLSSVLGFIRCQRRRRVLRICLGGGSCCC